MIKHCDAVTALQMPQLHPTLHRKVVSCQIKGDKHMLVSKTLSVSSVTFGGCADTPHVLFCFPNFCSNKLVCGYACSARYFVDIILPTSCVRQTSSRFKCFKIAWTTGGKLLNSHQVLFYNLEMLIACNCVREQWPRQSTLAKGKDVLLFYPWATANRGDQ